MRRTLLWIGDRGVFLRIFLPYLGLNKDKSHGLLSLHVGSSDDSFFCFARAIPNIPDVSTASKQPVGFPNSPVGTVKRAWKMTALFLSERLLV